MAYVRGLQEVGDGLYAYLQPDGGWGWSNAGLVVSGDESLLVDTLFDLRLTGEMLAEMRRATPAAARIDTLVNTHANGDHTFGNQLIAGARILASERTAEEMLQTPPSLLAAVQRDVAAAGPMGEFFRRHFAPFQFAGIELAAPDDTFAGKLDLTVGDRAVHLIEVGPAHTRGDTLVYLPDNKVLYCADILFHGAHPIVWAGPVSHWIEACERILDMDVEVVVPGHGPLAGLDAIREQRDYFTYLLDEVGRRYRDGMDHVAAAREIALGRYADWGEGERLVVNVHGIYRELRGEAGGPDALTAFAEMVDFEDELALA